MKKPNPSKNDFLVIASMVMLVLAIHQKGKLIEEKKITK
jgi:hypothetical protein